MVNRARITEWKATERYFRDFLLSSAKAERTAYTYVSNLFGFWRWCARYECSPYEADRTLIREWVADRRKVVSAGRVHNDIAAIKQFYRWLREIRERDDDPTAGVTIKRPKLMPTKPLSFPEVKALVDACLSERDRLLILMLASTGMRISELAGMRAEHIDWLAGTIKVHGKGDKERMITPAPEVLGRLHAYLGMFPEGRVWMSQHGRPLSDHQIRKIIYDVGARAKIKVHPHMFRATFAVQYIEQHGDLNSLGRVLGHESSDTTQRYTFHTVDERAAKHTQGLDFAVRLAAG